MSTHGRHRGPGRPPLHGARPYATGVDRRRARRYRMDVPVELPDGRGTTRDLSELGLVFDTTQAMTLGQFVEFNLVLGRFDPQGEYRVKCAGEVVRVEPHPTGLSVAISLRSYDLSR